LWLSCLLGLIGSSDVFQRLVVDVFPSRFAAIAANFAETGEARLVVRRKEGPRIQRARICGPI
jgi:hypothetical protein